LGERGALAIDDPAAGAALRGQSTIAVYRTQPMHKPRRFTKPPRIFDEIFLAEK